MKKLMFIVASQDHPRWYLTVMLKDGAVYLKDENGGMAKVTAVDLEGTNGIIHVIDSVVLPK